MAARLVDRPYLVTELLAGETLRAIREDEISAASLGVNGARWKAFSFGLSAAMRFGGAELKAKGWTHKVLCGSLGLAAAGLAAIAIDPVAGAAFLAAVLLATGFGLPYATALTEAQDLYPEEPAEPLALMTLVALLLPIVVIPLVGHAISRDRGDVAFGVLAAFLLIATLANLRRSGYPLTDEESSRS